MSISLPSQKFIKRRTVPYVSPLEEVTTRVSIRSLNKCIMAHSKERSKSKLSLNSMEFIIDRVPQRELDKYARHCLPVTVMCSNPYAYMLLVSRGMKPSNTWCLFQALFNGDEEMSRLIVNDMNGILNEEDVIPFRVAAKIGRRVSVSKLFDMDDVEDITDIDIHSNIFLADLARMQRVYVERALRSYVYRKRNARVDDVKGCDCPNVEIEMIYNDMKLLKGMADSTSMGYSLSKLDTLMQVIRSYGMLTWGYLEFGGHTDVDVYCVSGDN